MDEKLLAEMAEAERKALDAIARYKFWTFAYNAAWWVKLNRLAGAKKPNPFAFLVKAAREHQKRSPQGAARSPLEGGARFSSTAAA